MKISRNIKCLIGFAVVAVLDFFGGIPFGNYILKHLFRVGGETWMLAYLIGWFVLCIAALGMIVSLVAWLVAGMVARHKNKPFRQEDLSHDKSSA
jgi:cation transporter-like permease